MGSVRAWKTVLSWAMLAFPSLRNAFCKRDAGAALLPHGASLLSQAAVSAYAFKDRITQIVTSDLNDLEAITKSNIWLAEG